MKTHSKPPQHIIYWVTVPLRFTYRTLPDRQIIETHIKHMELPILSQHRKEIERRVKEEHLTPEDALISLIKSHTDDQIAQFQKEEPGLHVTITISGKLTYNRELLQDLKL
jgi:hypothetical protein